MFTQIPVTAGGRTWEVWEPIANQERASAPTVILLHEMPCLSLGALDLALRLSNRGYKVYVPLLFGSADDNPDSPLMVGRILTFSVTHPEWKIYQAEPRPVVRDLVALCAKLVPEPRRFGVVGLCLSGNLPLQLLGQEQDLPGLVAPVLAQPSLPFGCQLKASTGLGEEEEKRAVQRIRRRGIQVLGFRFELDPISPVERFTTLRQKLNGSESAKNGPHFIDRTLPACDYVEREHLTRRAHATLTDGYRHWEAGDPAEPIGHLTYRRLVAFLEAKLGPGGVRKYREPQHYPEKHAPVLLPEEKYSLTGVCCPRPQGVKKKCPQ